MTNGIKYVWLSVGPRDGCLCGERDSADKMQTQTSQIKISHKIGIWVIICTGTSNFTQLLFAACCCFCCQTIFFSFFNCFVLVLVFWSLSITNIRNIKKKRNRMIPFTSSVEKERKKKHTHTHTNFTHPIQFVKWLSYKNVLQHLYKCFSFCLVEVKCSMPFNPLPAVITSQCTAPVVSNAKS